VKIYTLKIYASITACLSFGINLTACRSTDSHSAQQEITGSSNDRLTADFCQASRQNTDRSLAHTIETLIKVLSAKDCDTMFDRLSKTRNLDLANRSIFDIAPLRYAFSLEYLDLSQNHVSDLGPVAGISSLKRLYASGNKLTSLPSPNKWANMVELNVSSNYVADISAVISMKSLESFDLSMNRIRSAQPLKNAKSLRVLYADENGIEDVSPLAAIVGLEQLHIVKNAVFDIRPLADLTALRDVSYLDLRENPISWSGCPVVGESQAVTSYCQSRFFDRN
jgi:Leucine-rich repeat (LRR) protein